ncbi:MAG: hypothetical protein KC910_20285 [Candidatus Eremiobacteraeota bacterium]|nr:hypothetical protein [Candidatus Eremiobacteraeota bacterium]
MLELLSQAPDRPGVFGLTSHESLCLLSEDNYDTPWWVIITPTPPRTFQVEYRPHEAVPPWKDAYVKVLARTPKEAVEQALFGMERSRAWTEGGGIGGEL